MSIDGTIAFVGAGNMADAILAGLLRAEVTPPSNIVAVDISPARREHVAQQHGVRTSAEIAEGVRGASTIVLSVKPQVVDAVLPTIREAMGGDARLISIAAGVTCEQLESSLSEGARVVRTMPNTPALVGAGATAIAGGANATEEDIATAEALFGAVGITVRVAEKQIDAVTGVSGSGPAYVYLFIEALADGGVARGLPRDVALKLAAQTVYGAGKLAAETGAHPGVLKDQVTSPGGTTIAAVHSLERDGLRGAVMSAVSAATARSLELGKKD